MVHPPLHLTCGGNRRCWKRFSPYSATQIYLFIFHVMSKHCLVYECCTFFVEVLPRCEQFSCTDVNIIPGELSESLLTAYSSFFVQFSGVPCESYLAGIWYVPWTFTDFHTSIHFAETIMWLTVWLCYNTKKHQPVFHWWEVIAYWIISYHACCLPYQYHEDDSILLIDSVEERHTWIS